jgi:hypothetical protein
VVDPAFAGSNFVDKFTEGMQAYSALPPDVVSRLHAMVYASGPRDNGALVIANVCARFPVDTAAQTLVDVLTFASGLTEQAFLTADPSAFGDAMGYTTYVAAQVESWAMNHNIPQR